MKNLNSKSVHAHGTNENARTAAKYRIDAWRNSKIQKKTVFHTSSDTAARAQRKTLDLTNSENMSDSHCIANSNTEHTHTVTRMTFWPLCVRACGDKTLRGSTEQLVTCQRSDERRRRLRRRGGRWQCQHQQPLDWRRRWPAERARRWDTRHPADTPSCLDASRERTCKLWCHVTQSHTDHWPQTDLILPTTTASTIAHTHTHTHTHTYDSLLITRLSSQTLPR